MYFDSFPLTFLQVSKTENVLVTDIIRAVQVERGFKESADLFLPPYMALDNETPELISLKIYDTVANGWIIQLLNNKFDLYDDFPHSDGVVMDYATQKYGDPYGVHHYEDMNGNIVDAFTPGKIPVTNFEYESIQNEAKRQVMLLRPELISMFVQQFQNLVNAN